MENHGNFDERVQIEGGIPPNKMVQGGNALSPEKKKALAEAEVKKDEKAEGEK